MFPAFVFTGFFITFFKFQTLEKTVILNLFLENSHGFFKIIINYFDFDFFQVYRPFLLIVNAQFEALYRWLFLNLYNVERDKYMKSG